VLDKRAVIQMLKVHIPTKAGRTAILSRDARPHVDPKRIAEQLNLDMALPPPDSATPAK
jgi:hypothetical protein